MSNKTLSCRAMALSVSVAILSTLSTYTYATPRARGAELSAYGEVELNGQKAISGVTIFSKCVVVTGRDSSASVRLGVPGRIELFANTNLGLSLADNRITGLMESGRARFSTPAGVSINLTTGDSSVLVDGSQATSFIVNTEKGNTTVETETGAAELRSRAGTTKIVPGEVGTAGIPQSTKKDGDDQPHRGSVWAAWLATGSVIAAAIWVVLHERPTHENDLNFGGVVTIPS